MKKFFYSFLFIISFLFTGCSQDIDVNVPVVWPYMGYYQPYVTNANGQYAIGGYVNGQQTRALTRAALHEGAGASYDAFALYVYTPDSTIMNPYHGVFSGNTWGYSEAVKYFDNFVSEYSFIGIIPQDAIQTYNESNHSVTVEANTFAVENENMDGYTDTEEVLYATTVVPKAKYSDGGTLTFNHANAKVYLKFKSNDPNTKIIDYIPGSPEIPESPGDTIVNNINTKALDALKDGYIIGWPYTDDNQPSSISGNPRFTINNYGGMTQEIADKVNAQFVYYTDAKGTTLKTDDFGTGNKKDKIYIKLASGINGQDIIEGNDEFIANASDELKNDSRIKACYNNGWRVIKIDKSYGGWTLWFLSNISQNISVTTITEGTEYQPAVIGKEGIIVLPASSVLDDGTDAVLETYPTKANLTVTVDNPLVWEATNFNNTFTFTKPDRVLGTKTVVSPTTWFTFPKVANKIENLGYTVKFSFIYQNVPVYDARVYIPATHVNWEEGKYYEYIININGRGNGHDEPNNPEGDDPVIKNPTNYEIIVNPNVNPYISGETHEYIIN